MDIKFRPAAPEDAGAVVPLIYSSGPAAFDYALVDESHRSAEDFLIQAFRKRGGVFGHGNHTVAVLGDQVVGAGACFSRAKSLAFTIAAIGPILSFYGMVAGLGVVRRGLKLERHFELPEQSRSYVAHLGIRQEWRSHGIGRRLVEHFLACSKRDGRTHATLDVSVENPRAEALYVRIGFEVMELRKSPVPNVPDHCRMEMQL